MARGQCQHRAGTWREEALLCLLLPTLQTSCWAAATGRGLGGLKSQFGSRSCVGRGRAHCRVLCGEGDPAPPAHPNPAATPLHPSAPI